MLPKDDPELYRSNLETARRYHKPEIETTQIYARVVDMIGEPVPWPDARTGWPGNPMKYLEELPG